MSLYGSGRSEGVLAVVLISACVLLTHLLGAWLADDLLLPALTDATLPALGGLLTYRFLRAQGRSRYAGFLVGAGYGLSPWLTALRLAPHEQLAAALAPLALEAVCRCDRRAQRDRWLPWAWLAIAAPFVAGLTVIAMLTSMLCAAILVRTYTCGDRDDQRPLATGLTLAAGLAALAAANLVWLDLTAGWLPVADVVPVADVLTAHRPLHRGLDVTAVLRVPGPVLLTFALLGLFRRQRHVDACSWWCLAGAGGVPLLVALLPVASYAPGWLAHPQLPVATLWLSLLAIGVLAAAGIDDFLDLPLRRRTALPWLLAIAVAGSPWLPLLGSRWPEREWPLTATFVGVTLLLPTWRQLGILRFKNWLATMAVVALAIPVLQLTGLGPPMGPAPLGEPGSAPSFGERLSQHAIWHYAGLLVAFGGGVALAASAWRRNRNASPNPQKANAAIVKKAKPSQRS